MELSYDRTGEGPALVLVHGITESRATWDPLVEPLAREFDVLTVDLRGHGRSPAGDMSDPMELAADVRDTVHASGLMDGVEDWPGPLVIGHSLGGVIATFYAAAFPTRGAVNVDQSLRLAGFKDSLARLEPMLRGDDASFLQAMETMFAPLTAALPGPAAERVRSIRRPDQEVVLGVWSSVLESTAEELETRIEEIIGGVTVPYLAIHGSDPGAGYSEWLTRHVPHAIVEVWDGLGHYPHLVAQDRFLARVRELARRG